MFADGAQEGIAFAIGQPADTASMLRDMIVDAWRATVDRGNGYPMISRRDIEAGDTCSSATISAATEAGL
jgi:hypothetical protein